MCSDKCEISAYMMNHRVSEQSPMRSNYLTYYKTRRSQSGHRLQNSPSDVETRHFEERSITRKRAGSNLRKLMPRRSESDLCLEDIRKQKKRSLLTTTLLNSNHEGWDFDHSSSAFGAPLTSGERLLQQKQAKLLQNNQENESALQDAWNSHRTNCSLTKTIGADSELHKNSTHFERLFGGRSNVHEFSALNAALPSRKLFFMQEYPNKLLNSEAKQVSLETAGCNKRRSYIETSRNLFGFSHKLPTRDKCSFPETCEGRYESSLRPSERPRPGTIAHDHEMYASYIGDHCRKNRRGRNSNKNSLPQSIVDVDSGLNLHDIRGDRLKRVQTSFDSHTASDLSSEYPISDCDESSLGNSNFSHFLCQPELNFNSYQTDKKRVKKGRNSEEKDKIVVKKYNRSSRCHDESEDVLDSSLSISGKISLSGTRRTKKKRQRSGAKKSPCSKQHAHEEENRIRAVKHYNDHRRQCPKDVDKKDVSHTDNRAHKMVHTHASNSRIREKPIIADDPGGSTKDKDPFKPQWTCTKWAKESRNKNKQVSSTSNWAYEVYSDTCLNPSINGMPGGFRNVMEHDEDIGEYDIIDSNQLEPGLQRLDFNRQVLCSANFTSPQSEEPHQLNRCETAYDDVPNVGIKPYLVANRNPMLLNHSERIASKLIGAVWTQMAESEKRRSNTDTIDDKKPSGQKYQHNQKIAVENKAVKKAEDKYNPQEKRPATENYKQGNNEKKLYIRKGTQETYLDQTYSNCTKQKQTKFVDKHQNSSYVDGDPKAPVEDASSVKNSIDEILIRTVHSIKEDIESVFARLNSFRTHKDDKVVKTALSLKDSVLSVLDQAKAVQRNQQSTNIVNAAEVVKHAIKALTFKTAFALGAMEGDDSHDMSYELYKMGKEEYQAGNEAGSNKHNIHIVSIDATRKPYYQLAIDPGDEATSVDNSLSDTDVMSCATLCPESICCSSTPEDTVVSLNGKGDGQRKHGICRSKETIPEGDESLVGSTVLKRLPRSAEKTPFSSAESTKSSEKIFDQKFEEMLARYPTDEREFEIAGIPKSLTRGRSPCSTWGKSKKKRKKSPHSKKHYSSSDQKKQQERSAAGEKPSCKSTKRKHSSNSVHEKSRERDKMKAKPETLIQSNTGVMMQPQVNKTDTPEDMLIEPLISSLALCEITDKLGTTDEATKKYREQMLQPMGELDIEEGGLEGCSSKESFLKKSLKAWKGSQEYPVTMHDIQIIYKIHSKTTLTEDEKSFINSISLHKTEEEILTVPYEKESTSQTERKKAGLDVPDPDNTQDSSNGSGGKTQNVPEASDEVKGLTMSEDASIPTAADVSLGHDQQKEAEISKEILSTEVNEAAFSERLESDIQGAANTDISVFDGYQLAKKSTPKTLNEIQEIPNTICKISDLAENAIAGLDSGKELSLESIDTLVSACKDIQEAQLNATIEIQPSESLGASVTSGYQKKRENTEQLMAEPDTTVNNQQDESIQVQPNEAKEKQTSKATQNEATDSLDNNTVSMLNASIMKLYEEVNKLRVKLEITEDILSPGASPKAEHSKSRSRVDSKKKKSSKDSKSRSRKSSSSSKSSRASSRGYTTGSVKGGSSPKKGHYFEATPLYADKIQKVSVENVSNTDLTTPLFEVGKLCCVYRKYETSCPETISEYYDRISNSVEQVSQVTPGAFYLEYDDHIISPAMYIEHPSPNTSPPNYMEEEDDASSVASYAEQMMVPPETPESQQHIQYFDKNLSRYALRDNSPESRGIGCENYWSDFKTVFSGKAAVIEVKGDQNEARGHCGIISDDRLNSADTADIGSLGVRSNAVIVDEYLSRDKQSIFSEDIVEYTSNTMTAETLGQQLNDIAAKMNSVSAQLGYHLRNACCNSNMASDQEDDIRKYESQPLECDNRIGCDLSCDSSLLSDDSHNKGNFERVTEKPQDCSSGQHVCQTDLISTENYKRDSSDISQTSIRNAMEQRNVSDSNDIFAVSSCKASETPRANNPTNCSIRNMPKVSTENVHQNSNEDVSDQEEEIVKPPTPPMWSDSEESLGKKEEDYIASLHIPRIVQCVKDMFFGSTKAQSKEACHQNLNPYDWQSGACNCSKEKLSNNPEIKPSLSCCQNPAADSEDVVTNIYANRRFGQSFHQNAKEDAAEILSSPLQQNYIFRKRDSRTNPEKQASPSVKTQKKTMPFENDHINEKSPHYSEYSWTGKDIGNYNFIGGNILLTSQPFVHYRSMGYLPAFRNVEETDKTIRHYCDAINTNAGKRLTSLEARCMNIPATASGQDSSSARMYGSRPENANEADGIRDYGRSPFAGSSPASGQNDWTSQECIGSFPQWQSHRAPSPLFCRYQENDIPPNCESTMQQRRSSYVEHCGFRQKRCDSCGNGLLGHERVLGDEINNGNVDGGVNKSKCFGVNGNNSSHDVTRKEDNASVPGRVESEKHAETLRGCTGMFYANEGMMDAIPFECSKKLESTVNKRLFTARDISETKYYNNSDSIRSVDYENEGQVKHYKQEQLKAHVKGEVEKPQTITEDEVEEKGGAEEDVEERLVDLSDDESAGNDAASDDTSMEDDEIESWYKTTDDESNS